MILSSLSSAFKSHETIKSSRLNSHYFNPKYITLKNTIKKMGFIPLYEILDDTSDFINPTLLPYDKFNYIEIDDLNNKYGFVEKCSCFLGKNAPNRARKSIQKKSILVSTVRPYLRGIAIAEESHIDSVCSTGLSIIKLKEESPITTEVLFAFLRSNPGIAQIEQLMTGANYPAVSDGELKSILIPSFEDNKASKINEHIQQSFLKRNQATELKERALEIVNHCLDKYKQESKISGQFNNVQALEKTRVDAKFFSDRFIEVNNLLNDFSTESYLLEDLFNFERGKHAPSVSNNSIHIMKTKDIRNSPIDFNSTLKISESSYDSNKSAQAMKGDLILTCSGEGTWGRVAYWDLEEKGIVDIDLTLLKAKKDIKIETVLSTLAFMWTEIGFKQFEMIVRGCTGQTHIYPTDLKKYIVPKFDNITENKLYNLVVSYHKLIRESAAHHNFAINIVEDYINEFS